MARELQPCGTWAAYQRHKRKGEDPCAKCLVAARDQKNQRKTVARQEQAAVRLAAVPEVEVTDPDPLDVARSNLVAISPWLFTGLTSV